MRAACEGEGPEGHHRVLPAHGRRKRMLCRIVSDSGADFIKTSTGFSDRRGHARGCGAAARLLRHQDEGQGRGRDKARSRTPRTS